LELGIGFCKTCSLKEPDNEQRTTNNEQRTTNNEQPTTSTKQRTTGIEQQSTIFKIVLKKKHIPFLLIIIMAIAILLIKKSKSGSEISAEQQSLNRNTRSLVYTSHARCRMACRQISDEEVREILQSGTVNSRKSDLKDKPCPSYAVEGRTRDNQRVRIVFGQCELATKVITVIDLDKEWVCDCSGNNKSKKLAE